MMMLLGAKACVTLLWGISVLFSMETDGVSIPDTDGSSSSNSSSTAEPNKANGDLATAHVAHSQTTTQSVTAVTTHRPAQASVATATTDAAMSATRETEEVTVNARGDSFTALFVTTVTATAGSQGPQWRRSSAAVTPAAGDAQSTHDATVSETDKPTEGQSQQQSSSSPADITTPASAPSATVAVSSPRPTASASTPSPSNTAGDFTAGPPHVIHSPSVSTTAETAPPGTAATPAVHPPSSPVFTSQPTSAGTQLPTTSRSRTHTSSSQLPATTELRSTSESPTTAALNDSSTSTSTSEASTNTTGIIILRVPKRLPVPTTRSTPAPTATTHEVSNSPQSTEVQPCSTRGVVKHCLIAIASLGGLAAIFMVTTIVLCTKLSARKYKFKKPQPATEMMCISALLSEREYTYTRQRNPISNGVRVFPGSGESEDDGGDNLTLSSFLPENDRYV